MGFPRGVVIKNPPADAGAESSLPLPGKSHRQQSLVGYSPWGRKVRYDLPTKQHVNSISTKLEEKTKSTIQNKRKSELTLKEAF